MVSIKKEIVVDDKGNPRAVIIPWSQFKLIEESLGLDLDEGALEDLRTAREDIDSGNHDAFVSFEDLENE